MTGVNQPRQANWNKERITLVLSQLSESFLVISTTPAAELEAAQAPSLRVILGLLVDWPLRQCHSDAR